MKRFFALFISAVIIIAALLLNSCGAGSSEGGTDTDEVISGSLRISVTDESGNTREVGVDEDKELASYTISCPENASDAVNAVAEQIRRDVEKKTSIALPISGDSERQIVLALDMEMGESDYSVNAKDGKIYISAGSEDALSKAGVFFAKYFVYSTNKSFLVPAGKGYSYVLTYFLQKLTIDGVDISEFSLYSSEDNYSIDENHKFDTYAENFNTVFSTALLGKSIPVAETMEEGGHYIVVSMRSSAVNPYSIKIENGNLYLTGSFISVDAAFDDLVSNLIGYTEGTQESNKTVELTAADSKEGSLGLTVPYTRDELLRLFEEMYEDDTKILSGTHTYGEEIRGFKTNGSDVSETVNGFISEDSQIAAILELDLGRFSPYNKPGVEDSNILYDYELSKIVSESMQHVSEGGVIVLCAHWANPYQNHTKSYSGVLPDGDEDVRELVTEGTELNKMFRETSEATHRFIKALSDNGIPFLYRPLHEMNADWFWWCVQSGQNISAEMFGAFWQYEYKLVTEELGVKDVIWVYSPSTNGNLGPLKQDVLYPYPGDDYVDIVGVDWYTRGEQEYNAGDGYSRLMTTGKIVAVTETGPNGLEKKDVDGNTYIDPDDYNCELLLRDLKQMIDDGLKVSYFSTWTRWLSILGMEGTKEFMADELIVSREELLEYWNNN